MAAKRCQMCGGSDLPLHLYGTASVYTGRGGKPVYACSSCDPQISEERRRRLNEIAEVVRRKKMEGAAE